MESIPGTVTGCKVQEAASPYCRGVGRVGFYCTDQIKLYDASDGQHRKVGEDHL